MGTAAASAGASGPSEGLRAGRSSGRTKPEYTAASGRHDHATTGRAEASVRRPGLGARLLATSDEARAGWYIADYSAFHFRAQVTEESVGTSSFEGDRCNDNFLSWRYFESVIRGEVALAAHSVLTPIPVWRILVLFSNREESEGAV